jgi:site-specific recombinase XerD
MLERYFLKPDTIDRIRASWIGEPIERYVQWLADEGYADRNVYRRVPILRQFGNFTEKNGAKSFEELNAWVEPFVSQWVKEHGSRYKEVPRWIEHCARTPVEQMLQLILPDFKGKGRSRRVNDPFHKQAPDFFSFLRQERGLRKSSLLHYGHYLRLFETYLGRIGLTNLNSLTPAILSAFLINEGQSLSKSSVTGLCSSLRVFLRYLCREEIIKQDLSGVIEYPRRYQFSNVPRSISWQEVKRMLEAVDRRTALGKRDYAILLLLVTYGLRGFEVAGLKLDDIDWSRERLLVSERKAGHHTAYPLSSVVGEAIVEYLKFARPHTSARHLFFNIMAPRAPMTPNGVSLCATRYLYKAGIKVGRPGSHTLRHTCVQRLVDAEFSFKTIGDYVGHASPSSTQAYAKSSIEALREVAQGHGEELP